MGVGPYDDTQADERNLLKRHLRKPNPLIIDVGANTGQYASLALSVHPDAKVISFEPQPAAFAKLSSLAHARNFKAFPLAVGASAGQAQIFSEQSSNASEFASLVPGVIEDIHHNVSAGQTVDVITLDEFCATHEIEAIDLLKVDVEGAELEVLRGAEQLIAGGKIRMIQLEFNSMNTVSKTFVRDITRALPGFRVYRLLHHGELADITSDKPLYRELFSYQNLVALPDAR